MLRSATLILALIVLVALGARSVLREAPNPAIETALGAAGDNRAQLQQALDGCSDDERPGMEFLVANMPQADRETLSAEFLLGHVRAAYRTWADVPWRDVVPDEVFRNAVLPYASVNERRDTWRADFRDRYTQHVASVTSPALAAAILNRTIFKQLGVVYSTVRPKADQSPYESIDAGLASCTGLSILLVDACRSVGIPARFVGTPLWSDGSGNHSWVEIWDDGWHFTGAAEPTGDDLDRAWFVDRARTATRDDPRHGIYAVSFRRTPLRYPLVWDSAFDDLSGVDVTDRYTSAEEDVPSGYVRVRFRVLAPDSDERRAVNLLVEDADGTVVFEGRSKDERFDMNDDLTAVLRTGIQHVIRAPGGAVQSFTATADGPVVTVRIEDNSRGE